jgi:hypothetical protein
MANNGGSRYFVTGIFGARQSFGTPPDGLGSKGPPPAPACPA